VKFRGNRLVAVLVPVAVAIIPISLLIWYDVKRIPSREEYLNQRNLRLLTTLSGVIEGKIDSFDGALDNAVKSFQFRDIKNPDLRRDRFEQGLKLFVPELDVTRLVLTKAEAEGEDIDDQMLAVADDPPAVRVRRDEGRYYLYLGAKLADESIWITARTDLNALLAPLLRIENRDLAAILVATSTGEVIAQNSPGGLTLARLDGVIGPPPAGNGKDPTPASTRFASSGGVTLVNIGGVSYKQYLQTIPLSLLDAKKKSDDGSRLAEEWLICGLVPEERFIAESAALTFTTLEWFSGLLAILALALPFVKLRALSGRERLRASDARLVTATTVMAIGLLTLAVLGGLTFGRWFGQAVDSRLENVATDIARHVKLEVADISRQSESFDAGLHRQQIFTKVSKYLSAHDQLFPLIGIDGKPDQPSITCTPIDACRTDLLRVKADAQPQTDDYPFFDLVTWAGEDGWQRVRWTPAPNIRPFVNIFEQRLPYAPSATKAWQSMTSQPLTGADVGRSPTTGDPQTAFWRATSEANANRVQSLAMATLVSLDQPVLPHGVSFAVVNGEGTVLFHSAANRRLQENFLTECEDDIRLRALLTGDHAQGGSLTVSYRGHDQRLHVAPLTLDLPLPTLDPGWHLVVFQDSAIGDTINLETLTIASALFATYLGILAIAATLIHVCAPWQTKWFWPNPAKRAAYRAVALLNAGATATFVVLLTVATALNHPDVILVGTVALALGTTVATYRTIVGVRAQSGDRNRFTWGHSFFLARAAYLLVVAALPAIACFHVAYWFEATLLTNEESVEQAADATRRSDRIALRAAQLGHGERKDRLQEQLWRFVSQDAQPPLLSASETPASERRTQGTPRAKKVGTFSLNRLLAAFHGPYNDIAGDLATNVALDAKAPQATSPLLSSGAPVMVGWLLAIVVALFAACFAFVYWLVKPMFALQAVAPPLPPAAEPDSGRVLQIGPFGSGKSTNLALSPTRQIIDIATYGLIAPPAPALSGAGGPGGSEGIDVPPVTLDPSTLAPELGIDHVDYRIEEPAFAGQTLTFLERAMNSKRSHIRIVCDRDPLVSLQESGAPAAELDRWARALRSCRTERVRVDGSSGVGRPTNPPPPPEDATQAVLGEVCGIPALDAVARKLLPSVQSVGIDEGLASFGAAASPYYESLWRGCTEDERLTLHQLAEEGLVNPQNVPCVRNLMRTGIIVRDPIVRIMNSTFREFVIQAATAEQVSTWERRGVLIPWGSIELSMLSVVIILAVLLIGTQRQVINAWFGIIPVLLPAGQKAVNWIAAWWPASKNGTPA
jgi:hypothetical protein